MTSSYNKDRYSSSSVGKSRRSSPGDSHNAHGVLFQTGQGGRTVLPPLANSFPTSRPTVPANAYSTTPYSQPRSTPKLDYNLNPQMYQYPPPTGASPQFPAAYANNYEMYDRHSPLPSYPYSSRSGTPGLGVGGDRARLPPLSTSPVPQGDRWQQQAYLPQQNGYHGNAIRSPIATYPTAHPNYPIVPQANPYGYHMQAGVHDHLSNMNPQGHHGIYDDLRLDHPRSNSPYGRSSGSSHVSSHGSSHVAPPRSYSPPPVTPTSPEEPTIKKKRKRADAAQLKVLNETYSRTAFPSTEERIALAKMLDMSARSVQIWFQNKRQSMRQTNRQSTSVASAHHQYALANQVDPMSEDLVPHPQAGYDAGGGPLDNTLYLSAGPQDAARAHGSHSHHSHSHPPPTAHYHTSSSHRHPRDEVVDPRKWRGP